MLSAPAELDQERYRASTFATGTAVYLLGGNAGTVPVPSATIEYSRFDSNMVFAAYNLMTTLDTRVGAASIVVGKRLYVIGGTGDSVQRGIVSADVPFLSDAFDRDFAYEPDNNLTKRTGHSLVLAGKTLHVIGGLTGSAGAAPIESSSVMPDGVLGAFTAPTGISLVTPRSMHTTVTLGNYVYVLGGRSSLGGMLMSLERAMIAE